MTNYCPPRVPWPSCPRTPINVTGEKLIRQHTHTNTHTYTKCHMNTLYETNEHIQSGLASLNESLHCSFAQPTASEATSVNLSHSDIAVSVQWHWFISDVAPHAKSAHNMQTFWSFDRSHGIIWSKHLTAEIFCWCNFSNSSHLLKLRQLLTLTCH